MRQIQISWIPGLYYSRRCANGQGIVWHVFGHDSVGAYDGAATDTDTRRDYDILAKPRSIINDDFSHIIDALVHNRFASVGVGMIVVCDVDVSREQNLSPDSDHGDSGDYTETGKAAAVADHYYWPRGAADRIGIKPASSP